MEPPHVRSTEAAASSGDRSLESAASASGDMRAGAADGPGSDGAPGDRAAKGDPRELSFEAPMSRQDAVAYLEALVSALRKGSIRLAGVEGELSLRPAAHVELEITARQKTSKERVRIEVSWRAAKQLGLTVSSDEH